MPIGFTVVVRNGDRHEIGMKAQGSRGDWTPLKVETPVATEEADHAQVEGSSAAPFPRIEPASNRPQLLHFPEHRPRIRVGRASGRREVAVAGQLGRATDREGVVSAASGSLVLAETSGAGLDQDPPRWICCVEIREGDCDDIRFAGTSRRLDDDLTVFRILRADGFHKADLGRARI